MIQYVQGNLLDSDVEALVNTVNTVGVMGKGIALMFKEAFPENYKLYKEACKREVVQVGKMFVTENRDLFGPRWIINFPTKQHWRNPSKFAWIKAGLDDLKKVIYEKQINSIALPPLGCGNGGLQWSEVKQLIESKLAQLPDIEIIVYEPTQKYMTKPKTEGVEELTPARALVSEAVRRYWILELGCTILEVQKLAWFLQRSSYVLELNNPLQLNFKANKYGPYADNLRHLLNRLDGSYLKCSRRLSDARPLDMIAFDYSHKAQLLNYIHSNEFQYYEPILDLTTHIIDGFESPFGLELLATVDWLVEVEHASMNVRGILNALENWSEGTSAAKRKLSIFEPRDLELALERIKETLHKVPAEA